MKRGCRMGDLKIVLRSIESYNVEDDVTKWIREAKQVCIFAGAGMSTSAGIPDFRSKNGLYQTIDTVALGLSQPEELFDIHFFRHDPQPFFSVAKTVFAKKYSPTKTHRFVRWLERSNRLCRLYTQNVDGLEEAAGIERCCHCHGSMAWSTCQTCRKRQRTDTDTIANGSVPRCTDCDGVMKPDITFFGEKLRSHVGKNLERDRSLVDLIIVIGTSLKVAPMSHVLKYFPKHAKRVLINREIVKGDYDVAMLGSCDDVVRYLNRKLGPEHALGPCEDSDVSTTPPRRLAPGVYAFDDLCAETFARSHASDNASPEKRVLETFVCDGCGRSIPNQDARYHCAACFDYDLCAACIEGGVGVEHTRTMKDGGTHRFNLC